MVKKKKRNQVCTSSNQTEVKQSTAGYLGNGASILGAHDPPWGISYCTVRWPGHVMCLNTWMPSRQTQSADLYSNITLSVLSIPCYYPILHGTWLKLPQHHFFPRIVAFVCVSGSKPRTKLFVILIPSDRFSILGLSQLSGPEGVFSLP